MRKDKVRAYQLRRSGKSYSQISDLLNVPKSTLSKWLSGEDWSRDLTNRLSATKTLSFPKKSKAVARSNKDRWSKQIDIFRSQAQDSFHELKNGPLFLSGLVLYWSRGDLNLNNGIIKISSNDPFSIKIFYRFLKDIVLARESKISIRLFTYPELPEKMVRTMWSKTIGISESRFNKSILIKNRVPSKRSSYGVCSISMNSREFKEKITTWIDLHKKEIA